MNDYAMTDIEEFAVEEIRGSWKVHFPSYDRKDKHGEYLRNYAIERALKTVQYYDACLLTLQNSLAKDQNKVSLNAIRRAAEAIYYLVW